MEIISREIVEQTWHGIGELKPDDAAQQMLEFANVQPNLLGFMTAFVGELSEDARELGIYLLFVVYRMFEASAGRPLTTVSPTAIAEKYEATQELMIGIGGSEDADREALSCAESERQPWVQLYVSEALFDSQEDLSDEERMNLSDDDCCELFILLKTVVDVLDENDAE